MQRCAVRHCGGGGGGVACVRRLSKTRTRVVARLYNYVAVLWPYWKRYCSSRRQFGLSRAVKWRTGAKTLLGAGAAAAAGFVLMLYSCVGLLEYLRCFNMSVDSQTPGRLGPYLAVAGRGASGRCIVVFFVFFVFSVAPVGAGDCLAVCVAVVSCLKLLKYLRERCGTERADSPVSVSVLRRCAHDLCVICV